MREWFSVLSSIHVVIVNWNAGRQLVQCLQSFATVAGDAIRLSCVTVVDNASTDRSLDELLSLAHALPLDIIRNKSNRGFAAACDQGAAGSEADYLLFLNPDTRLQAGCLEKPVDLLGDPASRNVGIVGIQLVGEDGEIARNCARRPTGWSMVGQSLGLDRLLPSLFPPHFLKEWPHDETREVDQVMGAFCFIRRPLFEALGGFDERFFVYFEDLDLALRARALGWTSVYLATAQAFHRGGGTTESAKAARLFYYCRSRILFAFKHFTLPTAMLVATASLVLEPLVRGLGAIVHGRRGEVMHILQGFGMLWADLANLIRVRRGAVDD